MHLYWSEYMDMQYLVNATEPHRTMARCLTLQLRSQSITKHLQNVLSATQIGNAICTCSISKSSAGKRLLLRLIIIIIDVTRYKLAETFTVLTLWVTRW